MTKTYLVTALTMLCVNLLMEYGTLTRRRGAVAHVLARLAAAIFTSGAVVALKRLGMLDSYAMRGIATLPFYFSCQYLFEESVAQKTFLYFMDYSATSFLSSSCVWVAARLPLGRLEQAVASGLFVLAVLLLLPLYLRRLRSRVRQMLFLFRNSNPAYAAYPVLSFVFFALLFSPVNVPSSLAWFGTMMLYVCLTVLTYYILFSHFNAVYDRLQAENSMIRAERQLALQKRYYEEVDRGLKSQAKLLHDTRHHLVALATMAETGDGRSVGKYVEGLLDRYEPELAAQHCENAAVNAVVGGYVRMAEEKGISVSADLDVPAGIGIDEYELCAFFGNTIENAIEACERIPPGSELRAERYITVQSWLEPGRFVVRMENSFQDDPRQAGPGFPSSKGSGIGLESVRAVVDRYQGSMSCERRGNAFVLSAVLCPRS